MTQPLCHWPSWNWLTRHIKELVTVAEMEAMHRPNSMASMYHRYSSYCRLWMSNLPANETNAESQIWGDQPATWWQINYIRPFPPWESQPFIFTGTELYSGNRLVSLFCPQNLRRHQYPEVQTWSSGMEFHPAWLPTSARPFHREGS